MAIEPGSALSAGEMRVLLYVCYFQPINFGKLARLFGKRSACDRHLRRLDLIGSGRRAPGRAHLHLRHHNGIPDARFDPCTPAGHKSRPEPVQ